MPQGIPQAISVESNLVASNAANSSRKYFAQGPPLLSFLFLVPFLSPYGYMVSSLSSSHMRVTHAVEATTCEFACRGRHFNSENSIECVSLVLATLSRRRLARIGSVAELQCLIALPTVGSAA
jgi:hypothetical protein